MKAWGKGQKAQGCSSCCLPRVLLGDDSDSDFPSNWKKCPLESMFRKLDHECHIGDHQWPCRESTATGCDGRERWQKLKRPMVRPWTAILHCRVPLAEEANVPQKLPVPEGLWQSTHIYVHGRDTVKDVPTSALSPLPEKMRVQGHTSLCGSKSLLSTSSLLRMPNREQQADSDLHQHQIIGAYRRKGIAGRAWSVSQDTMNNKCEPGTCCKKEAMVCERCVVYLQTHCVHLSSEAVSPLPDTCSLCCSGHPSELQSGPGIAEPQQWTCRNGACSVPVPQADAVCL